MTRCPHCGQPVHPTTAVCPRCGQRLVAPAPYPDADPNAPPWMQQLQADQRQPYAPTMGSTGRVPAPQPGMNPRQPPSYQQGWPSADQNGSPANMPPEWGNGNAGWDQQQAPGMGQRPGPQGYQPAPQPGQQGGGRMSAGAFFDESALPDWLRQSPDVPQAPQAPQPQQGAPRQAPQQYTGGGNAFPPIEQAGQFAPGAPAMGGMPASSLLDSAALPQWLGGQSLAPAQQQSQGYGAPANDGLPAQSLVDEQALPQWLRAQPNDPAAQAQAPNNAVPRWIANPASNAAAPSWMNPPYADMQAPQAPTPAAPWQPAPPSQPPASPQYGQDAPAGRMSANQFIDESALPEWLQAQGGQAERPAAGMNGGAQPWAPQQPAAQPPAPPRADAPEGRFSASDLIDPSAMPQWARGAEAPTFDSANGWSNAQRPSMPGETAAPDGYGRSSVPPAANGNGHGAYSQAARGQEPLATSELPSWLQQPRGPGGQQYQDRRGQPQYAAQQDQGYGYGADDGYGDYAGNGWDDQPAQEYDQEYGYGQQDDYGSYDDQPDPYGSSANWNGNGYQQDNYPPYPDRGGFSRSQAAPPPSPRGSGRKDDKPRGWRAIFRRK